MRIQIQLIAWSAALGLAVMAPADNLIETDVSKLRLLPEARLETSVIRLSDVVNFAAADPRLSRELGTKELLSSVTAGTVEISAEQVLARLRGLGVNQARILLSGPAVCRVQITPPAPANGEPNGPATATESPIRASETPLNLSLANVLRERISRNKPAGAEYEIEFEKASEQFLDLSTPPWDFEIRGGGNNRAGLREFTVTILRDGRVQRSVHVAANVRVSMPVVVASRPLNAGAIVRHDDVRVERRILMKDDDDLLNGLEHIIGMQMKRYVAADAQVSKADLRQVDLVQRSRPVTLSGGKAVQLRLAGVALDSGSLGETVRVRVGDDRRQQRELRGVVTGVGAVRVLENEHE